MKRFFNLKNLYYCVKQDRRLNIDNIKYIQITTFDDNYLTHCELIAEHMIKVIEGNSFFHYIFFLCRG